MKNKCHYNGEEFVPCERFDEEYNLTTAGFDEFIFCPFCGESLIKPESDKPWWLVPGMVVELIATWDVFNITKVSPFGAELDHGLNVDPEEIKPCCGPFDMVPENLDTIYFKSDGSGYFGCEHHYTKKNFPQWHNCPEEFKGKTFSLEGLK